MNVMITGASGGLGRAMAIECARRGYNLFLTDLNEQALLCIKSGAERRYGVTVAARACDLTGSASVDEMLRFIDDSGIRFDMLLNIAGVDHEGGFPERKREEVVEIVSLNAAATLRVTHAVLERRRENRSFTVVFVSSLASMFPMPLKAVYAASKRFLLDFAVALRRELRDRGVNALALCPGGMATNEETAKAIAAQGFWGDMTTCPLEKVARRTLDRALKGKGVYVPGVFNRVLCALGKIVPAPWAASAIYRRWQAAQKKWLTIAGAR